MAERGYRWAFVDGELRRGPGPDGILLPGLVNAHCHLELSFLAGRVPGGEGSTAWVQALSAQPVPPRQEVLKAAGVAAKQAQELGTGSLIDVSNAGDTAPVLVEAGLDGVVQVELLGLSKERYQAQIERLARPAPGLPATLSHFMGEGFSHHERSQEDKPSPTEWERVPGRAGEGRSGQISTRITAHSPISCSPDLLRLALQAPEGSPFPTLHCDEDPTDRLLLQDRAGPWAAFHEALSRRIPHHDWKNGLGHARSGVALLHALGLLNPRLGLVHLVAADDEDLDLVAESGATAILCPRSNLHIGGRLPDVPGMVRRGIPLAIGTDSLASSPDLDLLGEAATLRRSFPEIPPETWLQALTTNGARLVGSAGPPSLLFVRIPKTDDPLSTLLDGTPWPRTWIA